MPLTVYRTDTYDRKAKRSLTRAEREAVIEAVETTPEAGAVMRGTGGVRKLRVASPGRGKSGSLRVIYVWYGSYDVAYLLYVYSKTERESLSGKQRGRFAKVARALLQSLREQHDGPR